MWENWLSGKGSAHIFVYHQPPGRFNPETNDWEPLGGKQNTAKEFYVHDGKANKLNSKRIGLNAVASGIRFESAFLLAERLFKILLD